MASSLFHGQQVQTVGTGHYHSSLQYLGYAPKVEYGDMIDMAGGGDADIKPDLYYMVSFNVCAFFVLL